MHRGFLFAKVKPMNPIILAAMLALAPSAPEPLYTEVSVPGESMDQFAHRIKARAVKESMKVSGEICGEFRIEGEAHAITFYTIRHQKHCSYLREAGKTYTRLSYHTHIFIGLANDHLLQQKLASPRFSQDDFAHPGYMTTGKSVLFHSGTPGSVRRVSNR